MQNTAIATLLMGSPTTGNFPLDTKQPSIKGDDVMDARNKIVKSGPNGIAETTPKADDVQVIPVGKGQPGSTIISPGPSGRLNIAANPATDDVTVGNYVTSGPDGVANTAVNNGAEVSQAKMLDAVECHEGVAADPAQDSHWTRWFKIEAADTDMNKEAEDEIGTGTVEQLQTAVADLLDQISYRLLAAWIASGQPPSLPYGTVIDFKYPDPSFPAY